MIQGYYFFTASQEGFLEACSNSLATAKIDGIRIQTLGHLTREVKIVQKNMISTFLIMSRIQCWVVS